MGQGKSAPDLSDILNACADPIFVKDEQHRWILLNDAFCKFMGYEREELLGKSDYEFFPPEQAKVFWEKDELVFRTGADNENEEALTDSQGKLHIISTKKSIFLDPAGHKMLVGIIRDITELKILQRELIAAREAALEAARTKSAFLANMSHEIRTPMNGVIGMTQILLGSELNAEQRELTTIIKKSGEHLLSIINDILDFSKIEAGKVKLEQMDFNVRDTIEQVIDLLAARALEKEIELSCFVDPKIPAVLSGDPGRITEILLNLLGNALKFTERGAVILRVILSELDAKGARVRFVIEDSGIGIAAEDLSGLFQAFFQVDSSATRRYSGTGLGLAISRQLVEMMQGRMEVESKPGVGSTFVFTISLARASEASAGAPGPRGAPKILLGARVLVADPHTSEREVLVEQLSAYGISARGVASADEARRLLTQEKFALLFVDSRLPDRHKLSAPQTIYLSALGSERDRTPTISKPVVESRLIQTLEMLFDPPPPKPRAAPPPPVAAHHRSVLVVEDNAINQRVARSLLETLGYVVTLSSNGEEAVRAASDHLFSVILMDCQMPKMDGFAATREIRRVQTAHGARTPIIAMSASALPEDRARALVAGMDDYLTKPVQLDSLRKMLEEWIK
jgi:two-component system, sensor histidine kinase and response regulator